MLKKYKHAIKKNPIKTGKKIGTTYCLGCKDCTNNFKSQEIKMTNKVLRENLDLVNQNNNKNTTTKNNFSDNINCQIVFSNYKIMHMYCKNCKKHIGNTFPKKLILISKNKIKGKSKHAIFFSTKRTFIHEIEGKYDLDRELEFYLQFFTD